ncbi:MAG: RNA-binding domain-containing protein [Candidatus Nitrosomaritimum aestuariumsis]|jgi:RNA binding exosome subunit
MAKLEVTIDVIIHATEDIEKFYEGFSEMFELEKDIFSVSQVIGHFDNPIITIRAKITKKEALGFLAKFLEKISENQKNEIIEHIEERTENSTLYIRFDKQMFIQGKIEFREKEAIRLKIHTPVYNKKDTVKVFSEIFQKVI